MRINLPVPEVLISGGFVNHWPWVMALSPPPNPVHSPHSLCLTKSQWLMVVACFFVHQVFYFSPGIVHSVMLVLGVPCSEYTSTQHPALIASAALGPATCFPSPTRLPSGSHPCVFWS